MPNIFSGSNDKIKEKVETVIGPSVQVEGNFIGEGDVIVEGVLSGSLKTKGEVRVGSEAQIKAEIEAQRAEISGEIKGNIKVEEELLIKSSAKITGNIECKILIVEKGAIINGKCVMSSNTVKEKKNLKS